MIANKPLPRQARPGSPGRSATLVTDVELIWIESRMEHLLRFGHMDGERSVDGQRRVVSFAPGNLFALVRWQSNDFGTVFSSIDIIRTIGRGEAHQRLPFVRPGGVLLLHVEGWPKVERVLRAIDDIEDMRIDPAEVAPDYWRHVNNRLAARLEPRGYNRSRHSALPKGEVANR